LSVKWLIELSIQHLHYREIGNVPRSKSIYGSIENVCNSSISLYLKESSQNISLFCSERNKCCMSDQHAGYNTVRDALNDLLSRVGPIHRFSGVVPEVRVDNFIINIADDLDANHHKDVIPCKPDNSKFNSCVGGDQLILDAIRNKQSTTMVWQKLCRDILAEKNSGALSSLNDNLSSASRDGVGSIINLFPYRPNACKQHISRDDFITQKFNG
jgi:hypothetical protein